MRLNDAELSDKIRALLFSNQLKNDGAARRVAMHISRSGLSSLSWKERFIYLGRVVPLLRPIEP